LIKLRIGKKASINPLVFSSIHEPKGKCSTFTALLLKASWIGLKAKGKPGYCLQINQGVILQRDLNFYHLMNK